MSIIVVVCEVMVKNKYKYVEKYINIFKILKIIEKYVIFKVL